MPRVTTHIEIVEKISDQPIEQPWHVRVVRGEKTYTTEKFARKVGAQRSIIGHAKGFSWDKPVLITHDDGRTFLVDVGALNDAHQPIQVLHVREMSP